MYQPWIYKCSPSRSLLPPPSPSHPSGSSQCTSPEHLSHAHLLISWLQSPSAVILEPKKIKSVTVSIVSPSICREAMGPDVMIFVFCFECWGLSQLFYSFTYIKRLFSSSSLFAIRVVSSAYLRLLIFLLAVLIPAYALSSPVFSVMYSACKLNKQGDNIQPWRTPFPIWN